MDPELKRILANVQHMVSEGAPGADIEEYLQTEGYTLTSLNDAATARQNTGPTKQPPFPSLPPKIGGALDALVAFGAGTGVPMLSSDTRKYMGELAGRSPGGTAAAGGAGALATGGAGALMTAAKLPTAGAMLARMAGSQFNPITHPGGQSLAARVGPMLKTVGGPLAKWLAAGAGGAGAYEAIRRASGR